MSSHKTFSLSSVPFHAIWKPRNCIAGISSKKKKLLLVKLSRWRAKKSGPKFKMKIVFCISTNIRHDMHCFLNTTFNNQDCVIRYVCTLSRVEKSIQYYVDLLAIGTRQYDARDGIGITSMKFTINVKCRFLC